MKIRAAELIGARKQRVFEVFSDIANAESRIAGIKKIEVLSDVKSGRGLRWRETRVMFGREATEEMEITGFDEPHSYVVEAQSHGTHYTSRFGFDQVSDEKTAVTWEFEGRPISLFARLLSPLALLLKGPTEKALKQDMLDLKRALES